MRFGSHKLLAALPDGTPVGVAAARALRAVLPEVVAVVRPGDAELAALFVEHGLRIVECAEARQGMGHSLAAGVAATHHADAWLIALADMPAVNASTLTSLIARLHEGSIWVAPFHAGRRGHPVGISARFRDELLALRGDVGARAILERAGSGLTRVEVDDPGVLFDIDTPADLAAQRIAPQPEGLTS